MWGKRELQGWTRIPFTIVTFLLASAGWVFFRARGLNTALYVLQQMVSAVPGRSLLDPWQWRLALATLALAIAEEYWQAISRLASSPAWVRTAAAVAVLLAIELFSATDQNIPFVYFQF